MPFPFSDLTDSKRRPALIISNSRFNRGRDRICMLITSNLESDGRRISDADVADGTLRFESLVKPHRIFTATTSVMLKRLCTLEPGFVDEVVSELNESLRAETL